MCLDIFEEEQTPPWNVSQGSQLPRRELLVAQRIAKWREEEAAYRNRRTQNLAGRLLIDLAKRRPKTCSRLWRLAI